MEYCERLYQFAVESTYVFEHITINYGVALVTLWDKLLFFSLDKRRRKSNIKI